LYKIINHVAILFQKNNETLGSDPFPSFPFFYTSLNLYVFLLPQHQTQRPRCPRGVMHRVRRGVVRTLRGSVIQCVCHSECCGCALGFLGPGLVHLHIAPLQRDCCTETRRRSVSVPSLLAQPLAPSQGGEHHGAGLARVIPRTTFLFRVPKHNASPCIQNNVHI